MMPGRAPAYQVLADELREQITSGRLRPGQRLPTEPELCVRSGVSRSTVREALRLLASQHLIVTTRGVTGGSYVAKPDAATLAESLSRGVNLMVSATAVGIAELLEVRDLVEVPAAGRAARRRPDADVATLGKTLFAPVRDDTPVKVAAQRAFHEALAAATGNPVYELLARPLYAVATASDIAERAPLRLWRAVAGHPQAVMMAVPAGATRPAASVAPVHLGHLHGS